MTEFERIKAMDDVDLAIFLADLQMEAVNNYRDKRVFPKGYFDHLDLLRSEAKLPDSSLDSKLSEAVERSGNTYEKDDIEQDVFEKV